MDAAGEVCIVPLRERSLFLEVLFNCREILLIHNIMEALVSRPELIIVHHVALAESLRLSKLSLRQLARPALSWQRRVVPVLMLQNWETAQASRRV